MTLKTLLVSAVAVCLFGAHSPGGDPLPAESGGATSGTATNHPLRDMQAEILTVAQTTSDAKGKDDNRIQANVFVSPQGNDANPGTLAKPFRTVQKGADSLEAGDTCYVRAGVYRETVNLSTGGRPGRPMRIRAYPGEVVLFDGTEPIREPLERADDGVFSTSTKLTFQQLFAGDAMLTEARWPNCPPDRMLTRDGWATAGPKSEYQKLRDPELAETGIDWNGATAILNVAHQFWSWSRIVKGYAPGSDTLPYAITMNPFHTEGRRWWHDDYYYLCDKREALDVPGEWHLATDGTLSVIPPAGTDIADLVLRAKRRDYAFVGENLQAIEISGFQFFGCSFQLSGCEDCLMEYCNLLYPSYARGVPNAEEKGKRKPCPGTVVSGKRNVIRSCSFEHCPNFGVVLQGEQNVIENCIVHDVNWTGTLHYTAVALRGGQGVEKPANVARHNTLYNVGNTILVCSGPFSVVEYNHVHHGGLISADVSLLYTSMPSANGLEFRYNWVHDSLSPNHSLGIRGDDKTRGMRVHHNVVWNVAKDGIVAKGGKNRVYNNTCFANGACDIHFNSGPEPDKWWQQHVKAYEHQNEDSLLINNCAAQIVSTRRPSQLPLPGDHSNNFTAGEPKLVDPSGFDFRPRRESPLVDAGRAVDGVTPPFAGKAPDIGAYEYNGEHWLPGHRNGVSVSRPSGPLLVRLLLPILEPVQVHVKGQGGASTVLAFTPSDWHLPQALPSAIAASREVTFSTEAWGAAAVTDLPSVSGLADARALFERPDLASARHVDSRPKFDYQHSYTFEPTALPAFRAYFTDAAPTIDGVVSDDEWPGWGPARAIPMASLAKIAKGLPLGGEGYALYDGTHLFFAVRGTPDGDAPLVHGGTWGPNGSGEVEFDLAPFSRRTVGKVFVLYGYPSGKLESVTDGGADAESARRFGQAVAYAARIQDNGVWTCELRVPVDAFGVDLSDIKHLRVNLGLLKNAARGGPWFAAVRTGKANHALANGAMLLFDKGVRVSAENLLTGGDFEADNTSPWRVSTNRREPVPEGTFQRVRQGRRGDWCMRIQADDAQAMRERVFKWTHPIGEIVQAPGTYVLSYEVRVVGGSLSPKDNMGSFNSYLHVQSAGKPGGNVGQRPSMITDTQDRWVRREFVIDVPPGVSPATLSLQLHRATGSVLVDNVCLVRYSK